MAEPRKVSLKKRKCAPCTEAWMRWFDYRPFRPIRLITIGDRARDVLDRQEARYREWRDTVRWQQDHIERLCFAGKHAEPRGPSGGSSPPTSQCVSVPSL